MSKATVALGSYNNTRNFYPADELWVIKQFPIKESVAMVDGSLVAIEIVSNTTTGKLKLAGTENALGGDIIGILAEPIATTDTDYATAFKMKSVWVPVSNVSEAFFSVGAGTFTTADVFKTVEIHTDSKSLAVDTAGKGARITQFISSTTGKCQFSMPQTETA